MKLSALIRLMRICSVLLCVVIISISAWTVSPVTAATVTSVDVGWDHACALHSGQVWCWGKNNYGQLGDRTVVNNTGAVRAKKNNNNALENVTSLVTGGFHTCALTAGQVWCWGYNNLGQLGDRTNGNRNGAVRAAKNNGNVLDTVTAIAAGSNHTCALTAGQVWCWGNNLSGQLGDRSNVSRTGAVRAVKNNGNALTNVTAITAGSFHTCALTNGEVWCWGANTQGQLGNGTIISTTGAVRVRVSADAFLTGVTHVAAGGSTSCASVAISVRCWGNNQYGQVGDRTIVNKLHATQVRKLDGTNLNGVTNINVGAYHACAVVNRSVFCWGENSLGAIGNRTQVNAFGAVLSKKNNNNPLDNATMVAAGAYTTCAVNAGQAWCWGNNSDGQLGDRSKVMRTGAVRTQYYNGVAFP
jgi:alpha-tubulin suppressor-like RCC1 family protein